jgi:hypothetical protein
MTLRTDPVAAVLDALQRTGGACTVADIKKALEHAGAQRDEVDALWPRAQKRLRQNPFVAVEGTGARLTYRFLAPKVPTPHEALDAILRGGLPTELRSSYAELVRQALREPGGRDQPAGRDRPGGRDQPRPADDVEEQRRRRQAKIDGLRALAELAIEVEELSVNGASSRTLIQRVRGRVKRSALEPVDRAGDETTYDRTRHQPIGGAIADGAAVIVVRPGYVWKSSDGDVPLSRPVVEE